MSPARSARCLLDNPADERLEGRNSALRVQSFDSEYKSTLPDAAGIIAGACFTVMANVAMSVTRYYLQSFGTAVLAKKGMGFHRRWSFIERK